MRGQIKAFTLIELLTAIAIIVIVAAIMFSVLASSKKKAHEATCISQLKSIGYALELYSSDNNRKLPDNIFVNYEVLLSYSSKSIFRCPTDRPPYVNQSSPASQVLPTSYYPIPSIAGGFEEALVELDPNFSTFVCLLHGKREPILRTALNDIEGKVLRLRIDTSVTSANVGIRCHKGSDGQVVIGRDWWHVFTDVTAPKNVLEEIVGIKDPVEVPCSR